MVFGGGINLAESTQFSGGGLVTLTAGTFAVSFPTTIPNFTLAGGALNTTNDLVIENSFTWSSGAKVGAGALEIGLAATAATSSATQLNFNGGVIRNRGTWTMGHTGQFDCTQGAVFENRGLFVLASSFYWDGNDGGALARIHNEADGILRKTGAGDVFFNPTFENRGQLDIQLGRILCENGGPLGGDVSISGGASIDVTGGTLSLSGSLRVDGAGFLQLNGGVLEANVDSSLLNLSIVAGTLSGTARVTVTNSLLWTGGAMSGTGSLFVAASTTGAISSPSAKTVAGGWQFVNEGNLTHSGGNLNLSNGGTGGATLDNRGTLTINDDADIGWLNFNSQPVFVTNSGTIVKSGVGSTTVLSPTQLTNSGEIRVDSGALQVAAPTNHTGILNGSVGSTLNLSSGTFTLATGAVLTTGGAMRITGGTLVVNDAITCGGGIEITAGGLTANTAIDLPSLTMSGGTLAGTSILTVTDLLAWTGGTMSGSGSLIVSPSATGTISGPSAKTAAGGWQFVNEGNLTHSGGNLNLSNGGAGGATLDNRGTLTINDDADIVWLNFNSQPVFVTNSGSLVKSGVGSTTMLSPTQLTNSGEIRVDSGILQFAATTSHTGVLNGSPGTTLNWSSGTFTLATGAVLATGGAVRITGGTLVVNDAVTCGGGIEITTGGLTANTAIDLPSLTMSGGTLAGTGIVTVADAFNWTGGTMSGIGSLVVSASATAGISGPSAKTAAGGWQFVNEGNLTHSGGNLNLSNGGAGGATLDNRGTLTINDAADIVWLNFTSQPVFVINSGTLIKSGAGTTTSISPTSFTNSGLLNVRGGTLNFTPFAQAASGITHLDGGNISATALTFAAGRVTGVGGIAANVTNSGAVFSPGGTDTRTLAITGSYTQQAGGSLEFDLDGDSASGAFDKLTVSGAATLNGSVALRNTLALTGEVFPLVTYASRSGTFPTITVANNGNATASYLATRADFTVTADAPPAGAPQLALSYGEWVDGVDRTWVAPGGPQPALGSGGLQSAGQPLTASWDADPNADPDKDGAINLLEYAFQTNPLDPASIPAVRTRPSKQLPGCIEVSCEMRANAPDITRVLQASPNLRDWNPLTPAGAGVVDVTEESVAPGINRFTLRLRTAASAGSFLRWEVKLRD
jgi:hypothetical protein